MDSINQQQPEDNFKDLHNTEAAKKIKELAEKAQTCMFCTAITSGQAFVTRPMSIQKADDEGNLWFLSAKDSHKNAEIAKDSKVQLLMNASAHDGFLNLYGKAEISFNKEKIKELWEPILKTWFHEGADDPLISVIKFTPEDGYYWDNKHGKLVAFTKMVAGAVTGQTLDDSVEGNLSV